MQCAHNCTGRTHPGESPSKCDEEENHSRLDY
jgi:hypothetical protein